MILLKLLTLRNEHKTSAFIISTVDVYGAFTFSNCLFLLKDTLANFDTKILLQEHLN